MMMSLFHMAASCARGYLTKFIVNNSTCTDARKTGIGLFFTITGCQIVCSHLLTHRINYKLMCLSTY